MGLFRVEWILETDTDTVLDALDEAVECMGSEYVNGEVGVLITNLESGERFRVQCLSDKEPEVESIGKE